MTKEEIVNLANKCSQKIWEICMEEPGFSTNDCPEGANGLSDIILNTIFNAFPAINECSSITSNHIITIHLGRVVSDEVYDQIVEDIVRLLERKYPSDASWYLDS